MCYGSIDAWTLTLECPNNFCGKAEEELLGPAPETLYPRADIRAEIYAGGIAINPESDSMTSRYQSVFLNVFEALPRQGPGSLACTQRALRYCVGLPPSPRILDLGCGSGAQTLDLAGLTGGSILAIDVHAPLVERLRARARESGVSERVAARVADMARLELAPASFDLVWSEGALYNLGLEAAFSVSQELLRPGGYLAFTEAVWRTDDPPGEARKAFADYPAMTRVENVLSLAGKCGWALAGHFPLPADAWWDNFYLPMEQRINELRVRYADDKELLSALEEVAKEPDLHRRCGDTYGYEFFILKWG